MYFALPSRLLSAVRGDGDQVLRLQKNVEDVAMLCSPTVAPVFVVRKLRRYLAELMSQICTYSCNNICNKPLDCEKHYCQEVCHLGACEPCSLTPKRITTCCCGQTPLTEKREICLDPVPICDKIC